MLGSYTVWRPPSVFMLYVCYLYPLPAIVKLIALSKAPVAPPKPLTLLAVKGARPSRNTLHKKNNLSAGPWPADIALINVSPCFFFVFFFPFHFIVLFKNAVFYVKIGHLSLPSVSV